MVPNLFDNLIENHLFQSLPFPVEPVQLPGQFFGLHRIFRQEELYGLLCRINSSGSVDPGDQRKGGPVGIDHLVIDSRNQLQSAQTDPLALGHQFEPYFGKYAIFIHKRRNITDGPERHKIKVFPEIGIAIILPESFPPQGAAEGNKKVEYNANGGEMFEGKSTIRAMRIDSSERLRKGIGELMMVQDDRVHAQLSCIGDRFMIGYAAIYGDDQTDPLGSQSLYRPPVQSITLRHT